ncbi:MAG: glycoside hydrolase family 3 protein [Clostridia bacterium]|nr:glycoside hydrolase family 3 protein [Clostridia bacterium]
MAIKELKFEELTVEQKLGMVMCGHMSNRQDPEKSEADVAYALQMIREHRLGAIWVDAPFKREEIMARIREVADYPILILTDAESGFKLPGDDLELIGTHNAIGMCNTEESAYAFGKVTAINARRAGYNVVCDPVLDLIKGNCCCGMTLRSLGSDKHRVAALAAAEAQGLHDGGVLTVGKHFPSVGAGDPFIDSHMAETYSTESYEDIVDYYWYPYLELSRRGLLDGVMTGHSLVPSLDPDYPSSLSSRTLGLFRELGFDGFAITDALTMMGVVAKYGRSGCRALSVAGGNDLALIWSPNEEGYASLLEGYQKGLITDEMLDAGVKRVLAAQHKVMLLDTTAEITEQDLANYHKISTDGIFAKTDEGTSVALPRDKTHYFVIMCPNETKVDDGVVDVATMTKYWYDPVRIKDKLLQLYPGSTARIVKEYQSRIDGLRVTSDNIAYDDVVFVTFTENTAYVGCENFAPRMISLFRALQVTGRISTHLHFGNPFVLEDLPHISRVIVGGCSEASIDAAIDVLTGKHPALGTLTYDVKLN